MNLKTILREIKKHKVFLITTHVNPDIDGLACELAMALYLKSQGKEAHVVNEGKVLRMHKFLPHVGLIKTARRSMNYDAVIVLDCGDFGRIGSVKKVIRKGKLIINIDHHVTNDRFGDLNLIHTRASSTAEIIFDLLKEAKCRLTKPMVTLLYLGIMTDTGSFRYDNTTAHTHDVVARLMKYRFSPARLYQQIYETATLNDLKMFIRLIRHFHISHNGKVATINLSRNILNRFSGGFDLRDKIFSFLRAIKGVEAIAIFTEDKDDLTRINFRSQGKTDVARLAFMFNGGGHKKASGCSIKGNMKEARSQVFAKLGKILK